MPDTTQLIKAAKKTGNLAYLFRFPVDPDNVSVSGQKAADFVMGATQMLEVRPTVLPLYDADVGDDVAVITVEDVSPREGLTQVEGVIQFRDCCATAGTIGVLLIFDTSGEDDPASLVTGMVDTAEVFTVVLGAPATVCALQEPKGKIKKGVWIGHIKGYREVYGD